MAAGMKITPEAEAALRQRFRETDETQWVTDLAGQRGWTEANRRYLESMHEQGVWEMAGLMEDLGVSGPVSTEEALALLETALSICLPEADVRRTTSDEGQPELQIIVRECPTYACIERAGWHGVTACGSWHRRQGWYRALGVGAQDTVVGEKKWGDVACTALVQLTATPPEM